jgi:site-specific recombinase XerD
LDRLGYTEHTREFKLYEVAGLSRWLDARGFGVEDVNEERVSSFLVEYGANRKTVPTVWAMRPLLGWLRGQGLIAPQLVETGGSVEALVLRYRRWMLNDRGLAARTIGRYEQTARRFLSERAEVVGDCGLDGLDGSAVTAFLLAEGSRGLAVGSVKGRVAELRSLLRFLHIEDLTGPGLVEAVPPVAGWRDTSTPPTMPVAEVRALLASCDRTTLAGARDLAMLTVIARLGVRAAEIAGLELGDIDWRAGEVAVRGKGRRVDRLPLPADVGEALAGYLSEHRQRAGTRAVFVTVVAPWRPLRSTAVSQTVWRQCIRAGIAPVRAHRLRHALASELLAQGVKLVDISQVLGHRDLATTAAYAKVDHASLRELALPWPAVTR